MLRKPLAQTMWLYQVRAETYVVLLVTGQSVAMSISCQQSRV
jgi:hypothetical protein